MAIYLSSYGAISLSASTTKTAIEIATPSTTRAAIKEWWIDFNGTDSTAVPATVIVGRYSATVTTATTGAAVKFDQSDASSLVTVKYAATVEGAGTAESGGIYRYIPITSGYHYVAPLGGELILPVSAWWRIVVNSPTATSCAVGVVWSI